MKWRFKNSNKRPKLKAEEVGGQPILCISTRKKERKVLLSMLVGLISRLKREDLLFLTVQDIRTTSKI
jgi:hypothetical protein